MSKNKKQHYVPQCYLKNFSDNNKSVWAYDKVLGKIIQPSISNICYEKDLYTITDDVVNENNLKGNGITKFFLETDFFANQYEQEYYECLNFLDNETKKSIKTGVMKMQLSEEERFTVAQFIVVQFLRLPQIKNYDVDTYNDLMPKMVRLFTQGLAKETNNPELLKLDIESTIRDSSLYHAQTSYLNAELVERIALDLCKNIWTFSFSTDNKFYTSDFPICVNPHKKGVRPLNMGLTQEGAELSFPISKNLLLTIWDNIFFNYKKEEDMSILIANEKDIRASNLIRYFNAKRQIYSYLNDFSYVQFVVSLAGEKFSNPFQR